MQYRIKETKELRTVTPVCFVCLLAPSSLLEVMQHNFIDNAWRLTVIVTQQFPTTDTRDALQPKPQWGCPACIAYAFFLSLLPGSQISCHQGSCLCMVKWSWSVTCVGCDLRNLVVNPLSSSYIHEAQSPIELILPSLSLLLEIALHSKKQKDTCSLSYFPFKQCREMLLREVDC